MATSVKSVGLQSPQICIIFLGAEQSISIIFSHTPGYILQGYIHGTGKILYYIIFAVVEKCAGFKMVNAPIWKQLIPVLDVSHSLLLFFFFSLSLMSTLLWQNVCTKLIPLAIPSRIHIPSQLVTNSFVF